MRFKDIIYSENEKYHYKLSHEEKTKLFERSKFYIFFQDLLQDVKKKLAEDEEIRGFLPMNIAENLAATNQGINGMGHARTEKAKKYVKNFNDTRGNRLLIFTDRRMIYLIILDYLEEGTYYSYPYKDIRSIYLESGQVSYRDPKGFKKQEETWYAVDFQAGIHVFAEMFTEKDAEVFKENWRAIPEFNKIPQSKRIYRSKLFDRIVNNWKLAGKFMYFMSACMVLIALLLILGVMFGIGPLKGFYYKPLMTGQILCSLNEFWRH